METPSLLMFPSGGFRNLSTADERAPGEVKKQRATAAAAAET